MHPLPSRQSCQDQHCSNPNIYFPTPSKTFSKVNSTTGLHTLPFAMLLLLLFWHAPSSTIHVSYSFTSHQLIRQYQRGSCNSPQTLELLGHGISNCHFFSSPSKCIRSPPSSQSLCGDVSHRVGLARSGHCSTQPFTWGSQSPPLSCRATLASSTETKFPRTLLSQDKTCIPFGLASQHHHSHCRGTSCCKYSAFL